MRKHWLDNLRWVVVLSVLLYHVVYFYNNKGVFGGAGGFSDGPQYQDVVMYILYPWFMMLLFLVAGISARYSLTSHTGKEFFKARTRKLLVPATIGLFVFQWMAGYFNTQIASYARGDVILPPETPLLIKYIVWSISGIGHLWFVQDLWLFSLILLLVRNLDKNNIFWKTCGKLGLVSVILLGVLFYLGSLTLITNPQFIGAGLLNLYKPVNYFIPFLMGYFVFSHDQVQDQLGKAAWPLLGVAVCFGLALIITTFGQNNTDALYLQSPLNNLYGWMMMLAMLGCFRKWGNKTGKFATYMTRNSYGIYVVHYLFINSFGYMMKVYTDLPPVVIYLISTITVFTLSPLANEILRRIPVIRWCVLGEKV